MPGEKLPGIIFFRFERSKMIKDVVKTAGKLISKNAPHILTGLGIVSYVSAIVMAAKISPKAKPEYDRAMQSYEERLDEGEDKFDAGVDLAKDVAENVAPLYLGVAGMAVLGTVCVVAADKVHVKRQTAIMAAYTLSEKALDIYQDKVIQRFGKEKHNKVMDDIAESDKAFEQKPDKAEVLDPEGVLCYDHVTGRYFYAKIESVRAAEAYISKKLIDQTYACLNDFYSEMGMNDVSVIGDALGWDICRQKLDIHFTSMLDPNGVPCMVLNYRTCIVDSNLLYC